MSLKSKNLQFEAEEPAFLRRLRTQARGGVEDPDRQINPVPLPKKTRTKADEDDGPTYVLEGSDATISKEEYTALVVASGGKAPEEVDGKESNAELLQPTKLDDPLQAKQRLADVGVSSKKRKAVKVGSDDEQESKAGGPKDGKGSTTAAKKPKKKGKPIKLSFDDDDDG